MNHHTIKLVLYVYSFVCPAHFDDVSFRGLGVFSPSLKLKSARYKKEENYE
uniref:Uncharacterized protein n=1 Tax=Rhizophora mucronata TaxID=61149 RepID=A0A2P2N761_RHIMU